MVLENAWLNVHNTRASIFLDWETNFEQAASPCPFFCHSIRGSDRLEILCMFFSALVFVDETLAGGC